MNSRLCLSLAIASTILIGTVACSNEANTTATEAVESKQAADPCAANPCAAADPCAATDPCAGADVVLTVYSENGVAIKGADPVAYFTESEAVIGSSEFAYEWLGTKWHFSSAENRDRFAANPEQYAPQYTGHCAWAVSQGYTAPIDPEAWKIVDGKLYLNYSKQVQARWAKDIPGNIAQADANWPGALTQ